MNYYDGMYENCYISASMTPRGRVAQSVEYSPANQEVPGSILVSANSVYE